MSKTFPASSCDIIVHKVCDTRVDRIAENRSQTVSNLFTTGSTLVQKHLQSFSQLCNVRCKKCLTEALGRILNVLSGTGKRSFHLSHVDKT